MTAGLVARFYNLTEMLSNLRMQENMMASTEQQLWGGLHKIAFNLSELDFGNQQNAAQIQELSKHYEAISDVQQKYEDIGEQRIAEIQRLEEELQQVQQAMSKNYENTFGSVFTA